MREGNKGNAQHDCSRWDLIQPCCLYEAMAIEARPLAQRFQMMDFTLSLTGLRSRFPNAVLGLLCNVYLFARVLTLPESSLHRRYISDDSDHLATPSCQSLINKAAIEEAEVRRSIFSTSETPYYPVGAKTSLPAIKPVL